MSMRMKRQAMSQEVLRILRNTRRTLPWQLKSDMLNQFALRMKDSGYSEHIRQEIIEGWFKGYKNQLESDLKGLCPLYRPREWNREERNKKKKIKRVASYKPAEAVLFLPPTPRSELAKMMEEILTSMDTIVMNSKNEWIQPETSRIRVTREVTKRRNHLRQRLPG